VVLAPVLPFFPCLAVPKSHHHIWRPVIDFLFFSFRRPPAAFDRTVYQMQRYRYEQTDEPEQKRHEV
jgi:hypothetical protein